MAMGRSRHYYRQACIQFKQATQSFDFQLTHIGLVSHCEHSLKKTTDLMSREETISQMDDSQCDVMWRIPSCIPDRLKPRQRCCQTSEHCQLHSTLRHCKRILGRGITRRNCLFCKLCVRTCCLEKLFQLWCSQYQLLKKNKFVVKFRCYYLSPTPHVSIWNGTLFYLSNLFQATTATQQTYM